MSDTSFAALVDLLAGKRFLLLTGAGISTDSGLPDYRGDGSPRRSPMTIQQFMSSPAARSRYWLGSHLGWQRFSSVRPNEGHQAAGRMQRDGLIVPIVTQNVDELHEAGGASDVVHLHGQLSRVLCLDCGTLHDRVEVARWIDQANPWLELPEAVELHPDGDVTPMPGAELTVPPCPVCGGILKPDVVFFGELVPREVFAAAQRALADAEAVVVAGSSLAVNSAVRILNGARRAGLPVAVVNRGATRWDARADVRVEGSTSEVLSDLSGALRPR